MRFHVAPCASIPSQKCVALILALGVNKTMANWARFINESIGATLSECARVLRDEGGVVIVDAIVPVRQPWIAPASVHGFAPITHRPGRARPHRSFDNSWRPGIKSPGYGYRGSGDPDESRCLIALYLVASLGPVRIARLVRTFGSARDAADAGENDLAAVPGIGPPARGGDRTPEILRRR